MIPILLIQKKLERSLTNDEQRLLNRWLQASPEHAEQLQNYTLLWEAEHKWPTTAPSGDSMLQKLKQQVLRQNKNKEGNHLKVIASLIMTLTLIILVIIFLSTPNPQEREITIKAPTLSEAMQQLGKIYTIEISVALSEEDICPFSGTFLRQSNPEDILQLISENRNVKWVKDSPGHFRLIGKDGC